MFVIILKHGKVLACPTEVEHLNKFACCSQTLKWWEKSTRYTVKRKNGKGKLEVIHG